MKTPILFAFTLSLFSLPACTQVVGSAAEPDPELGAFVTEMESIPRERTVTPREVESAEGSLEVPNVIRCPNRITPTVAVEFDDAGDATTGWTSFNSWPETVTGMFSRETRYKYGWRVGPADIDHVELWCYSDRHAAMKLLFLIGDHIPEYHGYIEDAAVEYGAEVLPFSECYEIAGLRALYCE